MSDTSATRLEFSRSLYSETAVQEAVSAYAQLAVFHVEATEHTVSVTVSEPHPDLADLADLRRAPRWQRSPVGGRRAVSAAMVRSTVSPSWNVSRIVNLIESSSRLNSIAFVHRLGVCSLPR